MNTTLQASAAPGTPTITRLQAIPVAGRDGMLLNLSGAHGPFFTRNLLILTDSAGRTGVGEVPGGETIRRTLEDAAPLVLGHLANKCQAYTGNNYSHCCIANPSDGCKQAGHAVFGRLARSLKLKDRQIQIACCREHDKPFP